jgi:hypothetical protein
MAKKNELVVDPEIWIEIWAGKKPKQFRAWRTYGIRDALEDAGIGIMRSHEIADWARTAQNGDMLSEKADSGFEVKIRAVMK